MKQFTKRPSALMMLAMLSVAGTASVSAQETRPPQDNMGQQNMGQQNMGQEGRPDASISAGMSAAAAQKGPEIRGIITARSGDKMQVTADDGTKTVIVIDDNTRLKASSGLFGKRARPSLASLLNGLPITVQTMQYGETLAASQITFRNNDFKTANMIRNATAQGFDEQSAATNALRGRMADIDQYNIKNTTSVYFDTGKWVLSEQGKSQLCSAATSADAMKNALILVVGYTDSVGDEEYNQELSEKRASKVMNYLQQVCHWKPYRMLTPTGMAESDPAADNTTGEGKAQNRRVTVNVLVSKGLDGL